jgi:ribosome-associated toxin RatA of RatAB toxin-antitoxin module
VADLEGSESIEIDAPIARCFEIAADVERAPDWQGTMRTALALERDEAGRPVLVESEIDASVASVTLRLRFSYQEPTGMRWVREHGDLRSLEGSWSFTDLGDCRTRATYSLEIRLNRGLGLLAKTVRGPARDHVRHLLAHRPVEGLKRRAENS